MKLHVLIQSVDMNGDGYYQDSIQGIYQSQDDAAKALQQAIDNEPEDGDYGCVYYVQWSVQTHELIPATPKQDTNDPSTWPSIK